MSLKPPQNPHTTAVEQCGICRDLNSWHAWCPTCANIIQHGSVKDVVCQTAINHERSNGRLTWD